MPGPAAGNAAASRRLIDATAIRYLAASGIALAADMGAFLALIDLDCPAAPASAASYAIGIVVHWLVSSRAVFTATVARRGERARTVQKALFVGSAMIGLVLTIAIVATGDALGLDPRLAKLAAVGVSFMATWLLRERLVFRAAGPA